MLVKSAVMPRQHFSLRFPHYTQFINTLKSANEQPECWTEHEVWILIILNMHFPCKNTHFLNTYHCQSSEHHYHTLPWYEAHVLQFQSAKENWYRLSLSQHNKENAMRQLKSFLEQSSVVFFPDAFEDFFPCNKLSSFSKKKNLYVWHTCFLYSYHQCLMFLGQILSSCQISP